MQETFNSSFMCIINKYSNTYIKNYNELNYLNIIHIEHHKKVLQIGYIVSRLLNSIELGQQYHKKEDIDMTYKNKIQYLEAIQRLRQYFTCVPNTFIFLNPI